MTRWNTKKFAAAGLVIGIIGMLNTLSKETQTLSGMQIYMDAIEMLTPALLFFLIAWVQNRFVKN